MTSPLRSRVVEAVAEELEADCSAEAALDVMLVCLSENADEWAEETRVPTLVGGDALALVAVLREDR